MVRQNIFGKIAPLKPHLPSTLPEAHAVIQELHWQVEQFKKQLYGPSADRADLPESYVQEQGLMGLFPPPSEPSATAEVLESARRRPRRQRPEIKELETEVQRIEPEEQTCPRCGKKKCEIGCEKSERLEYIPARLKRQILLRPKLACSCGQGTVK